MYFFLLILLLIYPRGKPGYFTQFNLVVSGEEPIIDKTSLNSLLIAVLKTYIRTNSFTVFKGQFAVASSLTVTFRGYGVYE